jgi:integrase/recombinase XerD
VRRNEFLQLNWKDVDLKTGTILIRRGKWGKPRMVVIGIKTRRALIAYRRTISSEADDPLIQTDEGKRVTEMGIRSYLLRLSERSGVHFTPHALRRTFATLVLRAGMNPLHLQGLMGHTTLEMTRRYIQMMDEDLVAAHENYGPIDKFLR